MSRRRQPTPEEADRFLEAWGRYLRSAVVDVMEQDGGVEEWRSAVYRVAKRFHRLRRWEKRIAIVVLVSRALNSALHAEIESRAERRPQDGGR